MFTFMGSLSAGELERGLLGTGASCGRSSLDLKPRLGSGQRAPARWSEIDSEVIELRGAWRPHVNVDWIGLDPR